MKRSEVSSTLLSLSRNEISVEEAMSSVDEYVNSKRSSAIAYVTLTIIFLAMFATVCFIVWTVYG